MNLGKKIKLMCAGFLLTGSPLLYAGVGASGIAGVNWADGRDNFVDGWVIPSGLNSSDDYNTIAAKTDSIINEFQANMQGVNTVRLPINEPSVLENWWDSYKAAIDKASEKNMKVILGYWEKSSMKDGRIDDTTQFWQMWNKVVAEYQNDSNIYFEVMNEPFGYSASELKTVYADWLSTYSSIPRSRILLGGTGYSENVVPIGSDSQFDGTLLSLHNYAFWDKSITSEATWESNWRGRFGVYASRTVVTEYGAPMTSGLDYDNTASSSETTENQAYIAYIRASSRVFRNDNVASVYWPGLRDNDSYTIQTRGGSGNNITLSTTNNSGLNQIICGWGEIQCEVSIDGSYRIVNRNSAKDLDVDGGATNDGANVLQWTWNSGSNQQWELIATGDGYYKVKNVNSGKLLDVNGGSTSDGANILQWPDNGGYNQHWQLEDMGNGYHQLINRASGKALDVNQGQTQNGANVIQWTDNNGNNQQWELIEQ
ncbi:RICIN domain-containing protein [Catenovulum sp. 2E275]|uniref:RICIN domain-containing protein n=1 Tax=Catenovulum sp. 2E275 TaxID=2980497 RepID=UPI0021CE4B32|nr:RICIN domain-containing protein [Catenovulum sp. 2E275]MCU4677395.1 RICIN domain-containing protein [Catenovulum sp. 2E275]